MKLDNANSLQVTCNNSVCKTVVAYTERPQLSGSHPSTHFKDLFEMCCSIDYGALQYLKQLLAKPQQCWLQRLT